MEKPGKSWGKYLSEAVGYALALNFFLLPVSIAVATFVADGRWYLGFVALPATVVVLLVSYTAVRVVRTIRGPREHVSQPSRPPSRGRLVLLRTAAVLGLLVMTAGGIALMAVGVSVATNSPTCDPDVSRCELVVDGVNKGSTNTSVEDQRAGNVLTGGIAFVPGLALLVGVYFGASALSRSISAGRERVNED